MSAFLAWQKNKYVKRVSKALDFARWQGASRFKSGVYTVVLEYFKAACNTASGQKMMVLVPVLDEALIQHGLNHLHKAGNIGTIDIVAGGPILIGRS